MAHIIRLSPTYHLYRNNCQNFAKELVESICNIHLTVETINEALESLYDPRSQNSPPAYFPGSWRQTESTSGEYITAFSRTFDTALETSYHSAESSSVSSENPSTWVSDQLVDLDLENSVVLEVMLW